MERHDFESRFIRATEQARDFAQQFVEESLPTQMRFRLHLNRSYDAHAGPDMQLFPEDSAPGLATQLIDVSSERALEVLWRDGLVPQWIDAMVTGETGDATIISLTVCGRWTGDDERLYYKWTDVAPFGVKGPFLPVDYVEGKKFSIYDQAECWSLADLMRARERARKVWSLALCGPAFDDDVLAMDLSFPRLHVLELTGARIAGHGLRSLASLPALRCVRANLADVDVISFDSLAGPLQLESLSLTVNAGALRGIRRIAAAVPTLREFSLTSEVQPQADGRLDLPVKRLRVALPTVPDWLTPMASLKDLTLRCPDATEAEVARFLDACPASLDGLWLAETDVSDAIFATLARFNRLQYLDVTNTRVTLPALERFASARPTALRHHPRR